MPGGLNSGLIGGANKNTEKLMQVITPVIEPMGFDVIEVQVLNQREKKLQVYIDRSPSDGINAPEKIGIEDCVQVSRALHDPLDQSDVVESVFKGAYDLEVSSPGIDRPLRRICDFHRFQGQRARIHTVRPLNADESENAGYMEKNPKQKNFIGTLGIATEEKISFSVEPTARERNIQIPFSLITKAHLEPVIDMERITK